jgi:hypothetical protein
LAAQYHSPSNVVNDESRAVNLQLMTRIAERF